MNIEIAHRMAELRKRNGLSQEQLAEKLGISRQAVSKWERAESAPDTDNLIALARLYSVSLDELLLLSSDAQEDEQYAQAAFEGGEYDDDRPQHAGGKPIRGSIKWTWSWGDTAPNWRVFPYPVLVTFVYLLIGSVFDLWHPGWLLFLTVPIYYTALDGDGFNLNKVPYPLIVTLIYLIVGLGWDLWHPGWLLFLTIPLYYSVLGKMLGSAINMALIAAGVVASFALLGGMLSNPLIFTAVGIVLVGMGIWQTMCR